MSLYSGEIVFKAMQGQTLTGSHSKVGSLCSWRAHQTLSGKISARIAAMELIQAEFRHQLSEVLLTSQNNEQALKTNTLTLNSLATMVTSLMTKLESRSNVSEPNPAITTRNRSPNQHKINIFLLVSTDLEK